MDTTEIVMDLRGLVERLGFEYVGTEFVREGGRQILRLYADRIGGITLDDCETIARAADPILDAAADSFEEEYCLEVSSPGLERPLFTIGDYAKFAGSPVSVRLKEPVEGRRRFSGTIEGVDGETVNFNVDGSPFAVPFDSILRGHLVYIEQKGQKKTFKRKKGKQ